MIRAQVRVLVLVLVLVLWGAAAASNTEDVDECRDHLRICGPHAECSNTLGNYTCTCSSGFFRNASASGPPQCVDINECDEADLAGLDICGNGTCENLVGSFWCQCPSGFTNLGDERTPCTESREEEEASGMIPELPEWKPEIISCSFGNPRIVRVSVSPSEWAPGGGAFVLMGTDFRVSYSFNSQPSPHGKFQLMSPTRNVTEPATGPEVHFLFVDAGPAHKGDYTCVYINEDDTSEGSLHIYPLERPEVGVSVSEGEWETRPRGGVFVLMGGDFRVTCSVEFPLLGGSFQLMSPSLNLTLPAVNNSAHFLFTSAGPAHKGNYTCVYFLQMFNNVTSSGSLHIRPGVSGSDFLLRALVLSLLMLLNFIPYILYKCQITRLLEDTRGRQRSRRAAAEPGADAVSEMI